MAKTLQEVKAKIDLDKLDNCKAEKLINQFAYFLVEHKSKLLANTLSNGKAKTPVATLPDTL